MFYTKDVKVLEIRTKKRFTSTFINKIKSSSRQSQTGSRRISKSIRRRRKSSRYRRTQREYITWPKCWNVHKESENIKK